MRKISADYIFPIASNPIQNGIITIDDAGTIVEIEEPGNLPFPSSEIEYYSGIICPGFVNTHCHLELSHLHGKITENDGMTGFIKEIIQKRHGFTKEEIQASIETAEAEMKKNGIVAVGDISNNNSTFLQKLKGNLAYHTFIEVFSADPSKAEDVFENGKKLQNEILNFNLSTSIVPTKSRPRPIGQVIGALSSASVFSISSSRSKGSRLSLSILLMKVTIGISRSRRPRTACACVPRCLLRHQSP
jgi:hypothetical protein